MSAVAARLRRPRRLAAGPPLGGPLVVAPLAATIVAGTALAFAPPGELARMAPTEDGFYALAVARQLGLGHGITIDGAIETNGFQPLWSFLCAPLYALVDGDRVLGLRLTQLVGTALWLTFAAGLAGYARAVARRQGLRGDLAAVVAAVVAVGSFSVFRVFHNGLETGLQLLLLVVAVMTLDRERTWSPGRTAAVGLLLGALVWARLDAVAFVAAFGGLGALAWVRGRGPLVGPLAACLLAAVLMLPWLAWNVSVDGHLVPTSARAQATHIDIAQNAASALRGAAAWVLPPILRPSMHGDHHAGDAAAVVALALLGAAIAVVARRAGGLRLGHGTAALWLYAGFLVAYYVLAHAAWWFMDRYLAPVLVLAVPWLACAAEHALRRRPRAIGALAVAVAAVNLPLFAVMLRAPREPPAWAAGGSNTGTHPNLNWDQTAWTLAHVQSGCRVGALESGTLIYFRDRVVNLDGKVNFAALRARRAGRLPEYVRASGVDVLVDIRPGIRRATWGERGRWRMVANLGRFHVWARRGREGCVSARQAPEQRPRQVADHGERPAERRRRPHRVGSAAQA